MSGEKLCAFHRAQGAGVGLPPPGKPTSGGEPGPRPQQPTFVPAPAGPFYGAADLPLTVGGAPVSLVVDIYERAVGRAFPVITHIFNGRTREEAEGYFQAHLQTDSFLRGCVESGRWQNVECSAERRWVERGVPAGAPLVARG